jgi:prophage maintenance system killer protein
VIRYLTAEQIVTINADHGGTLNDGNGLRACVHRPQSGVFDVELFPDLWSKAAAYLHSISTTQYFSDGNKRTAWYAATTFLRLNSHPLPHVEIIDA